MPDLQRINRRSFCMMTGGAVASLALSTCLDSVVIDPSRLAVGGFSDGTTYAISLGLMWPQSRRRLEGAWV